VDHEGSHSVTDTAQREPATVVVTQPVKRGHDAEVRRWQETVNHAVGAFAGYLGNDVAPGGDDEWTVFYRFDSKPHLMKWLASPERAEVLDRGAHFFAGPATQHVLIRGSDAAMVTVVVSHPPGPRARRTSPPPRVGSAPEVRPGTAAGRESADRECG
jgi:heme-degrading monooxygenase HmoA